MVFGQVVCFPWNKGVVLINLLHLFEALLSLQYKFITGSFVDGGGESTSPTLVRFTVPLLFSAIFTKLSSSTSFHSALHAPSIVAVCKSLPPPPPQHWRLQNNPYLPPCTILGGGRGGALALLLLVVISFFSLILLLLSTFAILSSSSISSLSSFSSIIVSTSFIPTRVCFVSCHVQYSCVTNTTLSMWMQLIILLASTDFIPEIGYFIVIKKLHQLLPPY